MLMGVFLCFLAEKSCAHFRDKFHAISIGSISGGVTS